jgi:hypothetical protein
MKMMTDTAAAAIASKYAGKLVCFAPAHDERRRCWGLGIVIDGETGYYPVPTSLAWAATREDMQQHADDLNARVLKVPAAHVTAIVAHSMRGR